MHILMINHNVRGTGTFLRCYGFGRELAKLGHKVTLLTTSKGNKFRRNIVKIGNLSIVEFPDWFSGKFRNGFCLYNTLNRLFYVTLKKYDIIHAFDSRPVVILPALYLAKLESIPLVMDWADWWGKGGTISERSGKLFQHTLGHIEAFFEEKFRQYAHSATVISTSLYFRLADMSFDRKKILLIHNGCDNKKIKQLSKSECRKKLILEDDQYIIGYLGVLLPQDALLLFHIHEILKRKLKKYKLLLIGNTKINLEKYRNVSDGIFSTGMIPSERMYEYIGACDLMILPLKKNIANNGRWPSKINDYLSAGKPVISTPIDDLQKIFMIHKIGVIANDNPVDFSDTILRVLKDEKLQKILGNNARRYAETYLDWKILTSHMEKFYQRIVQKNSLKKQQD